MSLQDEKILSVYTQNFRTLALISFYLFSYLLIISNPNPKVM